MTRKRYSARGALRLEGDEALRELIRARQEDRWVAGVLRRFEDDVRHLRRMGLRPIGGGMPRGYKNTTESAVALSAATAKTIIGVRSGSTFGVQLRQFHLGFDGVTASAVPVLWELMDATFATNAPGTNSTSTTITQRYGRALASGMTAGKNWTTEPTVLTQYDEDLLTPNGGLLLYQYPSDQLPDVQALNSGLVLRLNAPATVNVRATQLSEVC